MSKWVYRRGQLYVCLSVYLFLSIYLPDECEVYKGVTQNPVDMLQRVARALRALHGNLDLFVQGQVLLALTARLFSGTR